MTLKKTYLLSLLLFLFSISLYSTPPLHAGDKEELSRGETIYIPVYSHIYSGNRERPFALTVTLSIRNIDPVHQLIIKKADYKTQGKLLKKYLDKPVTLTPLESIRYVVAEKDKEGGSGANFIVEWKSGKLINPPIVESIMIGTQSQQGISFTSRGRVIRATEQQ